jgi:hypothetical protein
LPDNKFAISLFFQMTAAPRVTPETSAEVFMFIFKRPLQAVAAGLAVPLLIVLLDRLANADQPPAAHSPPAAQVAHAAGTPAADAQSAACVTPAPWGIVRAGS